MSLSGTPVAVVQGVRRGGKEVTGKRESAERGQTTVCAGQSTSSGGRNHWNQVWLLVEFRRGEGEAGEAGG